MPKSNNGQLLYDCTGGFNSYPEGHTFTTNNITATPQQRYTNLPSRHLNVKFNFMVTVARRPSKWALAKAVINYCIRIMNCVMS